MVGLEGSLKITEPQNGWDGMEGSLKITEAWNGWIGRIPKNHRAMG